MAMEVLLIKYGYFILALGIAVEGEGFLLAGAFLAHRGLLNLPLTILVAVISNTVADQIYYIVAHTRGRAWMEARFGQHRSFKRAMDRMARHGNWLLLVSRYAFGFRIIIPAACGVLGMPMLRFTLINIVAGIIWAVPTALLGFYFGNAAALLFEKIQHYELYIILILLAAAAAVILVRHLRRTELTDLLRVADLHSIAPMLMGLMGVINLLSAILPRSGAAIIAIQSWLPLEVTQRSRPLMLFAGLALLQVTRGLSRRKELAWYVAMMTLAVSLLLHIVRAMDFHHSLIAALLMTYLIYFRRRFFARSDKPSTKRALMMIPILGLTVFIYGYVGLSHMENQFTWHPGSNVMSETFRSAILIRDPQLDPNTAHAAIFLWSLQIAGWLARIYLLILLLRPVILRHGLEVPDKEVKRYFQHFGNQSLAAFAIQQDKHHAFVAGGKGLVAYAVRGSVAFTCGDPLVAAEDLENAIREYLNICHTNSWVPCFYEVAETNLSTYHALELKSLKLAEEAIIHVKDFSLSGGARANLRASVNKAAKSGMTVRQYKRKEIPDANIDEQLEAISQQWLTEKHLSEMGFTMGRFSLEALEETSVFISIIGDRIIAFCSWLPYMDNQARVLDLMRKRKDAPAGTMDFLLVHSLLAFQAEGVQEASLANSPLANVAEPHGTLERGISLLFENMNSFYGYKNLFFFKKKFAPRWQGRYLIYPKGTDLPRVAYALTGLHTSTGLLQLLVRK
jgi:phosphatidylglycerol lysyltransferase